MTYEEAQQKLERLKRQYRDIDPSLSEAERIRVEIDELEVRLATMSPNTIFSPPPVLHNLPRPDYGSFIGRESELEQIRQLLSPGHRSWIVTIDGIGGIGKSALALEVAHRYLHQYEQFLPEERFDAIIWTSAKQTVLTADGIRTRHHILHTLQDIYTAIAVALQREDINRASAKEQAQVVTHALTQQRTLLLVDNLETVDDEAVLDFLRELPSPTKAIVTTRHRIDVAYPIRLNGMSWEDTQALILQECDEKCVSLHDDDVRRLYDRTDGVPLALVWSIAQMGFGYSPQAVLTRLGQPTNDITKFCFEGAIERIKRTPAYPLLLVLSLCADSANREALGYAAELPKLDRDDGLVLLEKFSLVNKKGKRFWLLPLTKSYAAAEFQSFPGEERLRRKWIEYFRTLNDTYSSQYWNWRNYDWLMIEGKNILAIVDRAIDSNQGEIALPFARAVVQYLIRNALMHEIIEYGELLHDIADSLNDQATLAWICVHWLGWFYIDLGEPELSEKLTKQGLSLYQSLDDVRGICFTMSQLGRIFRLTGRFQEDEEICKKAMILAEQHSYGDGKASINFELGKLARDRCEWKKSKEYWEEAIKWCENPEGTADLDRSFLIVAQGNLGLVECELGNFQTGKELLKKSLKFFEGTAARVYEINLLWRLTLVEKNLGEYAEAVNYAQKVLLWAERFDMKRELDGSRTLLEELMKESGDF
ncbi:MAG: ATP-binding protein [bacterium]|nr:ATP-binding protein [bacterium]